MSLFSNNLYRSLPALLLLFLSACATPKSYPLMPAPIYQDGYPNSDEKETNVNEMVEKN